MDITLDAKAQLKSEVREVVENTASDFEITYIGSKEKMQIIAKTTQEIIEQTAFVLPVISPSGEKITQVGADEINIQKPDGFK